MGSKRPKEVYQAITHSFTVIFWCNLLKRETIDPYIFDQGNGTGETFKRLLRYYAFLKVRYYTDGTLFQQTGAALQYAIPVRQYMSRKFPNSRIESAGLLSWLLFSGLF